VSFLLLLSCKSTYEMGDIAIVIAEDKSHLEELIKFLDIENGVVDLSSADFSHIITREPIPKKIKASVFDACSERSGWLEIGHRFQELIESGIEMIFVKLKKQISSDFQNFCAG